MSSYASLIGIPFHRSLIRNGERIGLASVVVLESLVNCDLRETRRILLNGVHLFTSAHEFLIVLPNPNTFGYLYFLWYRSALDSGLHIVETMPTRSMVPNDPLKRKSRRWRPA